MLRPKFFSVPRALGVGCVGTPGEPERPIGAHGSSERLNNKRARRCNPRQRRVQRWRNMSYICASHILQQSNLSWHQAAVSTLHSSMVSEIARVSRCNLKLIFQTSNFAQRVLYKYIISDKAFFTQSKTSLQLAFLSVPFHIGTSKKRFFADLCQSEQLIHQRQQSCISEFSHTVGRTRGLFAGCSWQ